ncbi:hypothetical protein Pcinc_006331 [Petrolisthes cinctipes]|uniref:C-type lectin domain-containing protein n=1 Tax=Petrolisthes cinctipes TaxID=88211 RepID=A0AAE1GD74_PETCI|nr:hypothetical protein Pcinc_006328 [Petrolisthes cinctipes]KAK3889769.1 hypothetical protein Pcinc_006331 [Petrolisthes cinctipes]
MVTSDCTIYVNDEGTTRQYDGTSGELTPFIPFTTLVEEGCIHYESSTKKWNDARTTCWNMGGDLFVAGDFMGMYNYLDTFTNDHVAVGVHTGGDTWLDGRPVDPQELKPDKNPKNEECFSVKSNDKLHTHRCDELSFICQLGVLYP